MLCALLNVPKDWSHQSFLSLNCVREWCFIRTIFSFFSQGWRVVTEYEFDNFTADVPGCMLKSHVVWDMNDAVLSYDFMSAT